MERVVPKTTIDFEDGLWLKLRSFMAATDAVMAKVIRRAISDYIDGELRKSPSIKEKYDVHRLNLLASAGGNIASISPRRRSRKSGEPNDDEPKTKSQPYK
jgi:hypothetical protein